MYSVQLVPSLVSVVLALPHTSVSVVLILCGLFQMRKKEQRVKRNRRRRKKKKK